MKILIQFLGIVGIWQLGERIHTTLSLPIPGSILGMLILFMLLVFNIVKLEWVENCSDFLLKHLAFFFIPSGVGLIAALELLKKNWLPLSVIIFVSTIIVMGITGKIVEKFVKD
ncbi:CidA/LrgA family protein [Inediibacterium massiliense]|uniref:CidA/LrgA family protein n=1 Tax=Inediibacterium massiliense TaxID=1658111 RepID=UPI0006B67405|nr:CidA/LrgA family protein [Inediibacterium massiliense]